jgi:site-specific recombinase XerD
VKYVINNQVVLSRAPEGPLASYIGAFAKSVSAQGYAPDSVYRRILLAACFSRWLRCNAIARHRVASDHAVRYLQYRARRVRIARGDAAGLRHFIDFLRQEGAIPADKTSAPRLIPTEQCAQAYEQYLREDCAVSRATVVNYVPFARDFLKDCFSDGPATLSALRACDVVRFVQRQARRLHVKRAQLMTAALRSFLRYARYRGEVTLDLAAAVPAVANWTMTTIPRAIAPDQVRRLLADVDRHTAVGRRDYAILLLLARLGLRSSAVVLLELDDIDWKAACLHVGAKGGRRLELPLSQEVGQAIAAYLRGGRPHSTSRRVFLRAKAPICGFQGSSSVASLVRHSIMRAGVEAPTYGAHQFRHGLATEMLRQGASLGEIGDVLGHRHPDTTRIYTKVDLKALHTLAQPWPGGVR